MSDQKRTIFSIIRRYSRVVVFCMDLCIVPVSMYFSYLLRFNFDIPDGYLDKLMSLIPSLIVLKISMFLIFGMYKEVWSKISLYSLRKIVAANCIVSFVIYILNYGLVYPIPRSIVIIDFLVAFLVIGGTRFLYRITHESISLRPHDKENTKRVIIIGTDFMAESLVREMRAERGVRYLPVAFLDDNMTLTGKRLQDIPVYGPIDKLSELVLWKQVHMVVIAKSNLYGKELKRVISLCENAKTAYRIEYKIIPDSRAIMDGRMHISQIRDVKVEDLLRRPPMQINEAQIERHIVGKKILITGAAGSIGSELVRQVSAYKPARLVLVDKAESQLYYLQREMEKSGGGKGQDYLVGDACNYEKMKEIFKNYRPDIVFHAAAYKHVPLMEYNPEEAIRNNVMSTKVLANLSTMFNAENFVMISTDKAIRPTNIMGASKRVSEMLVQSFNGTATTIFTTVRFGNVIGSEGSLVPVLMNQINEGGPVTITHRDMKRYFMTIPEAVRLIMQSMIMGKGNDVFVLDMGEPIRISELAEDLIRLTGYKPYEQIDIVYTGLRPGEKLNEELWTSDEIVMTTEHPGIKKAIQPRHDKQIIESRVNDLIKVATVFNREEIIRRIKVLVPEAEIAERVH